MIIKLILTGTLGLILALPLHSENLNKNDFVESVMTQLRDEGSLQHLNDQQLKNIKDSVNFLVAQSLSDAIDLSDGSVFQALFDKLKDIAKKGVEVGKETCWSSKITC